MELNHLTLKAHVLNQTLDLFGGQCRFVDNDPCGSLLDGREMNVNESVVRQGPSDPIRAAGACCPFDFEKNGGRRGRPGVSKGEDAGTDAAWTRGRSPSPRARETVEGLG